MQDLQNVFVSEAELRAFDGELPSEKQRYGRRDYLLLQKADSFVSRRVVKAPVLPDQVYTELERDDFEILQAALRSVFAAMVVGRRTVLDWAKTLRKEGSRSAILRSDDLARRYGIAEAVVGNALRRQERRGLVEHVSRRLYVNKLAHEFSPRELVGILRPDAYISLESALAEWGISTQSPSALTCVTTGFPRKFRGPSVQIVYRHIAKKLHWGFEGKHTRHGSYRIAEPEKALLDLIYLQRQEGLPTAFDELNLKTMDWKKLHRYALKYHQSVRRALQAAAA